MNPLETWGLLFTIYIVGYIVIDGVRRLINHRKQKPMATEMKQW